MTEWSDNKVIFIVGATASGKSNFSIQLAKSLDTSIISCDSMQIYREANIGTAKLTMSEMQGVKHFMIDEIDIYATFSVSDYAAKAKSIIQQLHLEKKIPIIVGGTGLYVDSLLYPMSFGENNIEENDGTLRKKLEEDLILYGAEFMHSQLEQIDPDEAKKIHSNNTKRVIRALEIFYLSGKLKSKTKDLEKPLNYNTLMIVLNPSRDILYKRINMRVDEMFDNGLENEVSKIVEKTSWHAQSVQAIGYKEFQAYFEGNLSKNDLKTLIKLNSRHYAKRQLSWFRRYSFANWVNLADKEERKNIIQKITTFIEDKNEF